MFPLPWKKKPKHEHEPHPIVYQWRANQSEIDPYVRVRRVNPDYPGWDALLQRRALLSRLKDKHFLPKSPRAFWDDDFKDVAAFFAELLQNPTHAVELGYIYRDRRYPIFRAGCSFQYVKFLKSDFVAQEVGRSLAYLLGLEVEVKPSPGVWDVLRDENHQSYWLGCLMASYKKLKAIGS
jgi:hypothetical protein